MPISAIDPVGAVARDHADAADLLRELFPLARSLTGEGVRQTHAALARLHPLETKEIPSGTAALDWTVPKEWKVHAAHLTGPDGRRYADFAENPLHLVNYSVPFRGRLARDKLEKHLHSLPERPDAIPYVTSYYAPRWGFCLSQKARAALPDGIYDVVVDTEHFDGSMTLSNAFLPGCEAGEIHFSAYTCHPHMANDELCGSIALMLLARRLAAKPQRRLGVRVVLHPETIGSVAYLAKHGDRLRRDMVAGYTVCNIGRAESFRYKRSRRGGIADRAMEFCLRNRAPVPICMPFRPEGSDERQYCSPGFDLPVGALTRSEPQFAEYHTSLDTPDLVPISAIIETVDLLEDVVETLDRNATYINLKPFGEPQLGRYGLYPTIGTTREREADLLAMLWLLNYSDGKHDLMSIAELSGHLVRRLSAAASRCVAAGILREAAGVQ
jgi:aminopeptidase-like protein